MLGRLVTTLPPSNGARMGHSTTSSIDLTCQIQSPAPSSFGSAKGPSMTVRFEPSNLTRFAFEVGVSPWPSSMTPAFTSSSLNFIIFAMSSWLGITPASEFLSAGTNTITRMGLSPLGSGTNRGLLVRYGPTPGSNIGRTSDSPSNPGQYLRCSSMNSVAIRIASALESAFRIAQPPMTSLLSEKGPAVTVILPLASRTRTPSLLCKRPPVSTRVPPRRDFSMKLPIASINAGGGWVLRYDSELRMNDRYFMAPPCCSDQATSEPGPDRHAVGVLLRRKSSHERGCLFEWLRGRNREAEKHS